MLTSRKQSQEATESSLRHVVGDNTLETLTTGREKIAQDVNARLQSYQIYMQQDLVQQ